MEINYIALGVPFFFLLIAVELLLARRRGVRVYRFNDAITDLSCGITSQLILLFWAAAQLDVYTRLYGHRLVTYHSAIAAPVVAFFSVDFLYYWWHRLSHRVNFLWAAHVVHHQSEDYNLAVALRQAVLTSWTGLPFYLPMALLGVPPSVYVAALSLSTLYQFWIHTELVGGLRGPLDWVLNLPSHHRVHHAVNPLYLDRNFGATLIIWDRLFGTFRQETEPAVYGITVPVASFNPLWVQVHYWVELGRAALSAPRWRDRLYVWFAAPDWTPPGVAKDAPAAPSKALKFDPIAARRVRWYVGLNFVPVVVATFALMSWGHQLPRTTLALAVGLLLAALLAFGALLEGRSWAKAAEVVRVGVSLLVLLLMM